MAIKKVLIVDDEQMARERIKRFLTAYSKPLQIFEAENGGQALEQIKLIKPEILLLDIQMPVMTGFDVLFQLENRSCQVIFQTAFDEFAVKAFEVNACDYLLKPFSQERLFQALDKVLALASQTKEIHQLEQHLEKSDIYLKTLVSKSGNQTKLIKVDEIFGFKSEDHYTFAVASQSEVIVDNSLAWLEGRLDPKLFIRCHRSNIVRISEIEQIGGVENSFVTLKNGSLFPLSRENRKKVLELFKA